MVLKMGGGQSAVVKMRWHEPVSWRKGNMKSRVKEVQDLGAALYDGLPRACAERWLTVKDGGTQEEDKVRYYLEPRIKMVVPYRQTFISGRERTIVDGTAKVYVEDLLTD
ncbi:MAG: hypothetical protein A2992_08275 [Elusimicrobia bacterium RIFCSPLOWO2_01_FULL_59_12]|nr:MAG: hypothetical protein A2992_08275 [Elusimicrobia bacterium RIFCSPLOWO2_01_FULL_59_12]